MSDYTPQPEHKCSFGLWTVGNTRLAAVAALAADPEQGKPFVHEFWDAQIPSGKWRYYDGMLYLLGMLHVSEDFKIYTPQKA